MAPIESVDPGWTKVVSRKQKRANMVGIYVEDESYGAGAARSKRRSNCYGDGGDDEIAARDENLKAEETKKLKPNKEKKKPNLSLLEAAENICPKYLEIFLTKVTSDALTLNRTMKSFRLKNEKAITEGGVNGSLYKEADESCKVILGRLSRGRGCLKGTAITAVVLTAAVVLSINLEATTVLKTLLDSLDLHL